MSSNFTRLERTKMKWKKDKNDNQTLRRSRRQKFFVDQTQSCIFSLNVSTSKKILKFTTINAEQNVRAMADKLEDSDLQKTLLRLP